MKLKNNYFDIIVIGAGHAGIEASYISSKIGLRVLLITLKIDEIGEMSCNPAIGGLAKGHLVKEIDALGGLMGIAIDECAIQYRQLNTRKGSAVRSSRAQADKYKYANFIREQLIAQKNITIVENNVFEFVCENNQIKGVKCIDGEIYYSKKTIVSTGTFLNGAMYIGDDTIVGGRWGNNTKIKLTNALMEIGLKVGRLKTGTPPRLDAKTIDFSKLDRQDGDEPIKPFSGFCNKIQYTQMPCFITYTNLKTHEIIRENLHRSPLFTGVIKGIGPRYCPSIEDKILRFPDKERHQIFLEPESVLTDEIYPNGISTSLPKDVQENFIRTIPGLEQSKILRYGYAVEYDFIFPTQLNHQLKVKSIGNLFLAGQINGTSGYEEAASQGLIAGINASNEILGKKPIILNRHEAYIGVLIDDLVIKGTEEPYRMFTSRAEHRLILREDNAHLRLTRTANFFNLINKDKFEKYTRYESCMNEIKKLLLQIKLYPKKEFIKYLENNKLPTISKDVAIGEYLKIRDISLSEFEIVLNYIDRQEDWKQLINKIGNDCDTSILWEAVKTEFVLEGYINREKLKIESIKKLKNKSFPKNIDYTSIKGLTREVQEKLKKFAPENLYEASQISGVTPAAIDILQLRLKKQ